MQKPKFIAGGAELGWEQTVLARGFSYTIRLRRMPGAEIQPASGFASCSWGRCPGYRENMRGRESKDGKGGRTGREEVWTPTTCWKVCQGGGAKNGKPGAPVRRLTSGSLGTCPCPLQYKWTRTSYFLSVCLCAWMNSLSASLPHFLLWGERIFSEPLTSTSFSPAVARPAVKLLDTWLPSETFSVLGTQLPSLLSIHLLVGLQASR